MQMTWRIRLDALATCTGHSFDKLVIPISTAVVDNLSNPRQGSFEVLFRGTLADNHSMDDIFRYRSSRWWRHRSGETTRWRQRSI